MASKKIDIFLCLLNIGWLIAYLWLRHQYPSPSHLKIVNGMIHHPVYGVYPEKVTYTKGMTLHPGQTALLGVIIEKGGGEHGK